MTTLFEDLAGRPLADRARPTTLDEFVGQEHLVGPDKLLRRLVDTVSPTSLILWGPPGTGKTTLARILAGSWGTAFVEISAVTSGIADVKKVIAQAADRRGLGQATTLFVDEIHRFNKAQQDAFLPHIENGTIVLIGATTENPSFEVIAPLLSRAKIVVLSPLTAVDLDQVIQRGFRFLEVDDIEPAAAKLLIASSGGDARALLSALETAAHLASGKTITESQAAQAVQQSVPRYDKQGESHYNFISAYIKSLRAGQVDAALFYLARMLASGEDVKFIARRLIIFASEDVGVADNAMLTLATTTFQAVDRIGMPEAQIVLSHATVALAQAPKSRAANDAIQLASQAVAHHPEAEVPLHLRNAPTQLMRELGYGKGYRWEPGFTHDQSYMPPGLEGEQYYRADNRP